MVITSYFGRLKLLKAANIAVASMVAIQPVWLHGVKNLDLLSPSRDTLTLPRDLFYQAYWDKLELVGVERVIKAIKGCGLNVALLGFAKWEDIKEGRAICQRRIFADWFKSKTGMVILEFAPITASGSPVEEQGSLF